jgi:hypothetical protein
MKNKFSFLAVIIIGMALFLGCGITERVQKAVEGESNSKSGSSSNKSVGDKAIESTLGDKIGIAECDEVIEVFTEQAKSPDDDFITKATKEVIFSKIKDEFKKSMEENKTDKVQLAKDCKMYLEQLKKFQAEDAAKEK